MVVLALGCGRYGFGPDPDATATGMDDAGTLSDGDVGIDACVVPVWRMIATGGSGSSFPGQSGHTCAIDPGGGLWCWGNGSVGQLGTGNSGDGYRELLPARIGTASDWRAVSAGWRHTCALRADGSAWCWATT